MTNKIDLSGKFAVVTGGAQGIGRAIVERFLDSGASVAIWDRDTALAKKTVGEVAKRGKAIAVSADVTNYPDVERARDETLKALGRIDILVNNAGIAGMNTTTWDYPIEEWRKVMSINLDGQFHCCKAVVPGMMAQNYGRIVNIASVAGKEGNPNASAYSASKAARHRADQVARQGNRRQGHLGQCDHAGRGQDRDLRADDAATYRLHAVEDSAWPLCAGR